MPLSRVRILHVEDDDTDAFLVQELLSHNVTSQCLQLTRACNLKNALKLLSDQNFDVILLDINLTDISGLDNIIALRDEVPQTPIVVLSGNDSDALAMNAIDHGAQEYLVKGHCNGSMMRRAINSSIRRKTLEQKLYQDMYFDKVTGLPNMILLQEKVEKSLSRAKRRGQCEALMFIDLKDIDHIQKVCDDCAADEVLCETARRMQSIMSQSDLIARYTDDGFAILLDPKIKDVQAYCVKKAQQVLHCFEEAFTINDAAFTISATVAIALYPDHAPTFNNLVKNKDSAAYHAKTHAIRKYEFAA